MRTTPPNDANKRLLAALVTLAAAALQFFDHHGWPKW